MMAPGDKLSVRAKEHVFFGEQRIVLASEKAGNRSQPHQRVENRTDVVQRAERVHQAVKAVLCELLTHTVCKAASQAKDLAGEVYLSFRFRNIYWSKYFHRDMFCLILERPALRIGEFLNRLWNSSSVMLIQKSLVQVLRNSLLEENSAHPGLLKRL